MGLVTEHSPTENMGIMEIRTAGGTRDFTSLVNGPIDINGTVTYHPQDWKMLFLVMGSVADAGSPSPYTHVIKAVNNEQAQTLGSGLLTPWISFGIDDAKQGTVEGDNFVRKFIGCQANELTISATQNELLECELSYLGQYSDWSSGAIPTFDCSGPGVGLTGGLSGLQPFLYSDIVIHLPSGTILDGIKEANVRVANNLEAVHYLNGSRYAGPHVIGNREYEVTLTMDMISNMAGSLYNNYYKNGTSFNMIYAVNATVGSRDMAFILSGCKIREAEVPSPSEGVNDYTFTIMGQTGIVNVNDYTIKYAPW